MSLERYYNEFLKTDKDFTECSKTDVDKIRKQRKFDAQIDLESILLRAGMSFPQCGIESIEELYQAVVESEESFIDYHPSCAAFFTAVKDLETVKDQFTRATTQYYDSQSQAETKRKWIQYSEKQYLDKWKVVDEEFGEKHWIPSFLAPSRGSRTFKMHFAKFSTLYSKWNILI